MKRKLLIILFLAITVKSFSQNVKDARLNWHGAFKTENDYIDLLKLKDSNSLIVKIGYSSYWIKGQNSELIVYQKNGEVLRFKVFEPNSLEFKTKIKRKRISRKNQKHYWNHLNNIIKENKHIIDKTKLNITEKKGEKEGYIVTSIVSDGAAYSFWIYQGKNYLAYGSYAPTIYIKDKYPGWKERQKLVKLMEGFEQLGEKY